MTTYWSFILHELIEKVEMELGVIESMQYRVEGGILCMHIHLVVLVVSFLCTNHCWYSLAYVVWGHHVVLEFIGTSKAAGICDLGAWLLSCIGNTVLVNWLPVSEGS